MKDFFRLIISNPIGLLIGLVVGVLLSLIIIGKANMKSKAVSITFAVLFSIIIAITGALIQSKTTKQRTIDIATASELRTGALNNNYISDETGLTKIEIDKIRNHETDAPVHEDVILNMTVQDYGDFICFVREENGIYSNIVFIKTSDGFVFDGVLMTTVAYSNGYSFFTPKIFLDSIRVDYVNDKIPNFISSSFLNFRPSNLVSLSARDFSFVEMNSILFRAENFKDASKLIFAKVSDLSYNNLCSKFAMFGNGVFVSNNRAVFEYDINTMYNYVYSQLQGKNFNTKYIVDTTPFMHVVIPEELRENYPMTDEDKIVFDYNDPLKEYYYSVYDCNIAINIEYVRGNSFLSSTDNNDETFKVDPPKIDKTITPPANTIASVKVNFKDVLPGGSDIETLNLNETPISIKLTANGLIDKYITITNMNQLKNGVEILLVKGASYDYDILSSVVAFNSNIGRITLGTNDYQSVTFNYEYYANKTRLTLTLLNLDSDVSWDFISNPITVTLKNNDNEYVFNYTAINKIERLIDNGDYLVLFDSYNYQIFNENITVNLDNSNITIYFGKIIMPSIALSPVETVTGFSLNTSFIEDDSNSFVLLFDSNAVSALYSLGFESYVVNLKWYAQQNYSKHLLLIHEHDSSEVIDSDSLVQCYSIWDLSDVRLVEETDYIIQVSIVGKENTVIYNMFCYINYTGSGCLCMVLSAVVRTVTPPQYEA